MIVKGIPNLSEKSDDGFDRSLVGSLGLRGAVEYELEFLVLLCGFINVPDKYIIWVHLLMTWNT